MAERLLYLPSVGLCVLAGHLAASGLAPEDPRPLVQAARALAALGRLAGARERLRRALALDPRDAEGRRLLDELAGR